MNNFGWEILLFLLAIAMVLVWLAEIFEEESCKECENKTCVIDDLIVTGIVRKDDE